MTNETKKKLIKQLIEGIAFLHENDLVHRDIKPKNILVDKNFNLKISDLGVAKILLNKEKTESASSTLTTRYASNELLFENITSFKCDIWAVGLVIYEILTEKKPWGDVPQNKIIIKLGSGQLPFEEGWEESVSKELDPFKELVCLCAKAEWEKHPTALDLLNFITDLSVKR